MGAPSWVPMKRRTSLRRIDNGSVSFFSRQGPQRARDRAGEPGIISQVVEPRAGADSGRGRSGANSQRGLSASAVSPLATMPHRLPGRRHSSTASRTAPGAMCDVGSPRHRRVKAELVRGWGRLIIRHEPSYDLQRGPIAAPSAGDGHSASRTSRNAADYDPDDLTVQLRRVSSKESFSNQDIIADIAPAVEEETISIDELVSS
jgi:hypothetical protein